MADRLTSLVLVALAEWFEMRVGVAVVMTRLELELILLLVLSSEMLDFVVAVVEPRSLKQCKGYLIKITLLPKTHEATREQHRDVH